MYRYIFVLILTAVLACKQQKTIKSYIAGTDRIGFLVSGYEQLPMKKNLQRTEFRIYKFSQEGAVDSSFGDNGYIAPAKDVPRAKTLKKYVVDKKNNIFFIGSYSDGKKNNMILLKYTPFGMPDTNFGQKGMVTISLPPPSGWNDLTVDTDGRPLVTGWVYSGKSYSRAYYKPDILQTYLAIWRFCKSGLPDSSFAKAGFITYTNQYHDFLQGTSIITDKKNDVYVTFCEDIWKYSSDGRLLIDPSEPHCGNSGLHGLLFGRRIFLDNKDRLLIFREKMERFLTETNVRALIPDTSFNLKSNNVFCNWTSGFVPSDSSNRMYFFNGLSSSRIFEDGLPDFSFNAAGCVQEKTVTKFDINFHPPYSIHVLNTNNLLCHAYVRDLQDGSPMRALFFETYDEQACSKSVRSAFEWEEQTAGIFNDIIGADIVVTRDNGFLIAGTRSYAHRESNLAVISKYTADNRLDVSFGHSGYITNKNESVFDHIAVGEDGSVYSGNDQNLYKYTPAGTPDASFGKAGFILTVKVPEYHSATISDLIVNDHNIIVAGYAKNPQYLFYLVIGRYTLDGTPDSTFGVNGIVSLEDPRDTGRTSAASKVTFDKSNNLLVAGQLSNNITLWRFKKNGTLDTTFGGSGYVFLKDRPVRVEERKDFEDVAIDNQGRILISGAYEIRAGEVMSVKRMVVARYFQNGTLDTTFGEHGFAYSRYDDESMNKLTRVSVGPDGTIFFAYNGMTIWRYDRNGRPDTSSSDSGFVDFGEHFDRDTVAYVKKMVKRGNELIVLGGATSSHSAECGMRLWRLPGTRWK